MIATSLSAYYNVSPTYIVEDGVHSAQAGTSMAVPHASGASALLLQRDPTATAAEIKAYLMSTARADAFTGAVPNAKWGVGKLDVQAAMSLTPMYTDISTARIQANGTPVKLPGQAVTAGLSQFSDRFYIENADRTAGIQVRTGAGSGIQAAEGSNVTVKGTIGLADGERAVLSPTVTPAVTGTMPGPLSMVNRSVGGGLLGDYVPGVTDGVGLNNIGLLVKVWGRVTYVGGDHFYIDDGTGLIYTPGRTGIKVFCGSLAKPVINHSVVITGISTLDWDGSTARPVVRARKQSDLRYY
jgi:subtilisin family serine protease